MEAESRGAARASGRSPTQWIGRAGRWPVVTGVTLLALCAGCASRGEPPPQAQFGAARAAISQAEAAGAGQQAAVELLAAREKLAQAEAAARNEDNERARWAAEEAEADARLAESRARAMQSGHAVTELQQSLQTLRAELQRQQQAGAGSALPPSSGTSAPAAAPAQ